jgi:hypothetical protein
VGRGRGVRRLGAVGDSNPASGVVGARDFAGRVVDRITRTARGGSEEKSGLEGVLRGRGANNAGAEVVMTLQQFNLEGRADSL